jgi:hypothetical protein
MGTAPATIGWAQFLTVNDNVDGRLDVANAVVNYSGVNFARAGKYDNSVAFTIKDASGNEGSTTKTVTIYDGTNTSPPTLAIKAEYRNINLDENTSDINWKDDFVDSAVSRDGLDIKESVSADLSEIDTTTAGEYPVTLTITDYAGNKASQTINVTVARP